MAELAPVAFARHVPLANSIGPMFGLAVGAVFAGLVMDTAGDPAMVVFAAAAGTVLVLAAAQWTLPETAPRRPGAIRSLRPVLTVPKSVRPVMVIAGLAIVASWSTGGLFISLGATIAGEVFGASTHVQQGATIGTLAGFGALGILLLWRRSARSMLLVGTASLAVGAVTGICSIMMVAGALFALAVAVTGVGFGTAYAGALRLLLARASETDRVGLFSAIYVIAYLAFSVPAVIAGVALEFAPLTAVVEAYGLFVALCAATVFAVELVWRRAE